MSEVENIVKRVHANAGKWRQLSAADKLTYVRRVQANLQADGGAAWSRLNAQTRGYHVDDPKEGHLVGQAMMLSAGLMGFQLQALAEVLETRAATGHLPKPTKVTVREEGGQVRVQTFPHPGWKNYLASSNMVGELCLAGTEPEQPGEDDATQTFLPEDGVVVVLGAGNTEHPSELFSVLFVHERVAVMKPNPVNAATAEALRSLLKPLVDDGFCDFVFGGVEEGQALLKCPGLVGVTITGAARSYNRIVWGDPDGPASADQEPLLKVPVVAELGSVNPYVVVPGEWSEKELDAHASMLVASRLVNGGHVCACTQVVVTSRGWPQRRRFLDLVRAYLSRHAPVKSYYPGARSSYETQIERILDALGPGARRDEIVVAPHPDAPDSCLAPVFAELPSDADPASFFPLCCEAFAPVLVEVALDAADVPSFLDAAVDLSNNKMWGSLSGTMVIDPRTAAAHAAALETAVDQFEVGALGVNVPAVYCYLYPQLQWGAYGKGHPMHDIKSGRGRMGNAHGYRNVLKAVMRAPFMNPGMPKSPLDPSASLALQRRTIDFAIYQSWTTLTLLIYQVLRG